MGSRAGSTAKLPISRTASGSVLDKRQEHDTGTITRKHQQNVDADHINAALLVVHLLPRLPSRTIPCRLLVFSTQKSPQHECMLCFC